MGPDALELFEQRTFQHWDRASPRGGPAGDRRAAPGACRPGTVARD